jgi:hypothetical protein
LTYFLIQLCYHFGFGLLIWFFDDVLVVVNPSCCSTHEHGGLCDGIAGYDAHSDGLKLWWCVV